MGGRNPNLAYTIHTSTTQTAAHLHQNTATKSFSFRTRSSCLAVTSSITGSECFLSLGEVVAGSETFLAESALSHSTSSSTVHRTIRADTPIVTPASPRVKLTIHRHRDDQKATKNRVVGFRSTQWTRLPLGAPRPATVLNSQCNILHY